MNQTEIVELIKLFDNCDIGKLKIKQDGFLIKLEKKELQVAKVTPTKMPEEVIVVDKSKTLSSIENKVEKKAISLSINSPMVGTFYKAASPTAMAYAKAGDIVKKGKPIGIIEAMKVMNELEAEFDCKIIEVLVEDGQPVQFDMPLFAVEKI